MAIDLPASAGQRIALIAHDNKKQDMLEWAEYNLTLLTGHELFATATTGRLLQQQLALPITCFPAASFPAIRVAPASLSSIDLLVFFWDPLEPHPHDPDVKALLRVAVVCNIPTPATRRTGIGKIIITTNVSLDQAWDPAADRGSANTGAPGP